MPDLRPKKILARISDRKKAPRRWWYPELHQEPHHPEALKELHAGHAKTINKTMFTLLGVGLYCLLKVLGESDKSLIVANSTIQTPLVGTSISFQSFLLVTPFLLVILVAYLHILYGYWLRLEREREEINNKIVEKNSRMTGGEKPEPTIESIPAIFSFKERLPRLFTNLIFYWFVPLTLWIMAWKAFALVELRYTLFYVASFVSMSLLFLQINRCPDSKPESQSNTKRWRWKLPRWIAVNITSKRGFWNLLRWIGFGMLVAIMAYLPFSSWSLRRPLDLQREDLHGAWLQGLDMADADMNNANLQEANLAGANLQGANLRNANIQKGHLSSAHLQNAQLNGANLQGGNLGGADFDAADLFSANLREVKEMELYRIQTATNWNRAFYSSEVLKALKLSPIHNEDLEKIGTYYEGGKVAYIFQPGDKGYVEGERHGLIAAKADLPGGDKYTWDDAKKACMGLEENGYSDWYLPSKDELYQLYLNRSAVGGFVDNYYWSSTELDADSAWNQYFGNGYQATTGKYGKWRVRPVRTF